MPPSGQSGRGGKTAWLSFQPEFCLFVSGVLLYKLLPRNGMAPVMDDGTETAVALGLFMLMIFGLALIVNGSRCGISRPSPRLP